MKKVLILTLICSLILVLPLNSGAQDLPDKSAVTQEQFSRLASVAAIMWWAICFALIFFMQSGFLLLEAGSVRAKNAANVATKVIVHTGIAVITFYCMGFAVKSFGWPWCFILKWKGKILSDSTVWTGTLAKVPGDYITGFSGWLNNAYSYMPWSFNPAPDVYIWAFFGSLLFCVTSMATPGTVFSERFSFKGYILFAFIYSGIIYPVFGWLIWGGLAGSPILDPNSFLLRLLDRFFTPSVGSELGKQLLGYGMVADASSKHFYAPYTDYAGSTGVHSLGGLIGLVGALYIGPRIGKFKKDGGPVAIPSHNVPMAVFGALLLAFCWFGFNGGSVIANYFNNNLFGKGAGLRGLYLADYIYSDLWWVIVVTVLAGSGGILGSLISSLKLSGKADPLIVANGLLGALVGICSGVGFVHPFFGFIIGFVCGFQFPYTLRFVERTLKIDDAIGTIPCHTVSGIIGSIMAGIWGQAFWWGIIPFRWVHPGKEMIGSSFIPTLPIQIAGVFILFLWAIPVGYLTFLLIDKVTGCRVSSETEEMGLDISEHGLEAYPRSPEGSATYF